MLLSGLHHARLLSASRCFRYPSRLKSTAADFVDGPPITETNRAETTLKRFWKTVGVENRNEGIAITLDKRALKTPSGNILLLPHSKRLVATLIAAEWENQKTVIKPYALPMTSLAARAIDYFVESNSRQEVRKSLLEYLDTDTICFYQDYPPPLVSQQETHWDPLYSWAEKIFDVKIEKFTSILSNSQSEESKKKLLAAIDDFNQWEMAALERGTHATKSFIIALALVKRRLTVDQASEAARVEVNSQIERWGEVEDTHDVDFHDIRRQLGSAALLLSNA
ncbi:ATP12-domain-containing protein [Rhodocollybia butyracea]|uniref:ATP12-domain-containing protein n=1 Tax=Rhodocollybia butyracea TaxID=206335 RepID=A0A9P5U9A8_9AGAR|nr:ATP12-domain-containing protein [Rhodocollybia butyracea]